MFFLNSSPPSSANVDGMPHKYGLVYKRHAKFTMHVLIVPESPIADTISSENSEISSINFDSHSNIDISISQCKGSCTLYLLYNLWPTFSTLSYFVSSIDSYPLSKFVLGAISHAGWRVAMKDEMHALEQNELWTHLFLHFQLERRHWMSMGIYN